MVRAASFARAQNLPRRLEVRESLRISAKIDEEFSEIAPGVGLQEAMVRALAQKLERSI